MLFHCYATPPDSAGHWDTLYGKIPAKSEFEALAKWRTLIPPNCSSVYVIEAA